MLRRLLPAVFALLLLSATPARAATCDRYASPFGSDYNAGTQNFPYRTAQMLSGALRPGETGCLAAGTYAEELDGPFVLRLNHGGAPGAPITIRSAPGQRATLRGIVYLPPGSDHVTLSNLDFDTRRPVVDTTAGIQILAADTIIEDSTITNHRAANCMILGVPGWGQAVRTIVRRNVFTDCGGTETIREHAVYVEYTQGVLITDNVFDATGAYAVHMYPEARGTTVSHNVMANGGGGVIFAGEAGGWASRDNVVEHNIITGTWNRPGIHGSWGGPVGTGNVARDNCFFNNPHTHVDIASGGFSAARNVIANPGYRNAAAGDFRLAPGSPCLSVVGYDTAAKLRGEESAPAPAPTPTVTPSPSATATSTPAATKTPVPTPTTTPTPAATATPTPTPEAPEPVATPEASAPPSVESPADNPGPDVEPVEAAVVFVDSAAFSFSGGSMPKPAACKRKPRRCR